MSLGAKALAPCGHWGEAIIGQYVACKRCDQDAIPDYIPGEKTKCLHLDQYTFEDKVWCWVCGSRISG